ncbi:helix-turn-helix domain-containing protein [Peribacillus simplex]|nr:helix-turn-helix domain-containing protein [Peribacillus simplex]MDM5295808.1 helix-turn-helix domain-containing protein [Peribacillus simplex]
MASPSTMDKWLKQLGENGIDDLEPNKKGRPSMKKETKKIPVEGSIRGFTG